jgi:hypothetical protein
VARKIKLEEGILYRVLYKSQSRNDRWYKKEMWAVFLGEEDTTLLFSLRPLAGTQELDKDNLLEAYEMPHSSTPKKSVTLGRLQVT